MEDPEVLPGTTGLVVRQGGQIRKLHPPGYTGEAAARLRGVMDMVARAGISAPVMVALEADGGQYVTVWEDLGHPLAHDWAAYGHIVRRLHDLSPSLVDGLAVDVMEEPSTHQRLRDSVRGMGEPEGLLEDLQTAVERALSLIPEGERVIVHDDLWAKNFLTTPAGSFLIDWDNVALASRNYDLSFIVRALDGGDLTAAEARSFEDAYSYELPPLSLARQYGALHRARWCTTLIHRAHHGDRNAAAGVHHEAQYWRAWVGRD